MGELVSLPTGQGTMEEDPGAGTTLRMGLTRVGIPEREATQGETLEKDLTLAENPEREGVLLRERLSRKVLQVS